MSDRLKTICACDRFYNRDSGFVYELNRALTAEECFGKPSATNSAYYRTDALEVQPWDRRTLEEPGNPIRVMRVRHADGEDSGILFAVPLEYLSDEVPVSYMLFIVSDGTLDSQFSSLEGATCVLSYQDTPFYSTNAEICEQIYEGRGVPDDLFGSQLLSFESGGMRIEWRISIGFQMRRIIPTIVLQSAVTFVVMAVSLALLLYISRKTYQPIQNLLSRLPPRPETEGMIDDFKYINFMLDDYDYDRRGQGIIRSSLLTTSSAAYDSRRWGNPLYTAYHRREKAGPGRNLPFLMLQEELPLPSGAFCRLSRSEQARGFLTPSSFSVRSSGECSRGHCARRAAAQRLSGRFLPRRTRAVRDRAHRGTGSLPVLSRA